MTVFSHKGVVTCCIYIVTNLISALLHPTKAVVKWNLMVKQEETTFLDICLFLQPQEKRFITVKWLTTFKYVQTH